MSDRRDEPLWVYTHEGAFPLCSTSQWQDFVDSLVNSGWERPSADALGWLHSKLNPYPPWSFFTAEDAANFAAAVAGYLSTGTETPHGLPRPGLEKLAALFAEGAVLILPEPPRMTASTNQSEAVYIYCCPQCGFVHHGRWLFDMNELSPDDMRSSVESLLKHQYCALCGSRDIVSDAFFLPPFDPDCAPDIMAW